MSQNMNLRNIKYDVDVGDLNVITGQLINSDGTPKDVSDTITYNTLKFHVWQPNGTPIISDSGSYGSPRTNGLLQYTLKSTDTVLANAGNWEGVFICYDINGNKSDTSETFNFTINPVY